MRAAELYQASKKSQKRMRKFIIGLVLFVIALIGINSAMTFMMVELGKETKASDGIDARPTPRRNQGLCRENRSQRGTGATHICSSRLRLCGTQAVRDQVRERRVPLAHGPRLVPHPRPARSKTGNAVKIITYAGFIILDGAEMTFEEVVGKVFSEAGFDVGNGRKLLGMYELIEDFSTSVNPPCPIFFRID